MTSTTACLYPGKVMHRRLFPVRYRFTYRIFSMLVDIDEVAGLASRFRFFSHNKLNLVSFHDGDHGPRVGTSLRVWVGAALTAAGIDLAGGAIRILCFPRVLGYAFNPLSIWYCHHADGSLKAVLCEVRNTFGEKHGYLLHDDGRSLIWPVRAQRLKQFHVSPFISMDADYHFRLSEPAENLNIVIREHQHDALMLVAAQTGRRRELSDATLLAAVLKMPFMTFQVVTRIHWQAVKLWFRRAPFYSKPSPPAEDFS